MEEARLTADVSGDEEYYKEFSERTGDTHAMFAWVCYKEQCQELGCTSAMDVASKAKVFRNKVKSAEFAYTFGATADTISKTAGIDLAVAEKMVEDLDQFFSGLTAYKKKAASEVQQTGKILICPETGHTLYWWDWQQWKDTKKKFTKEFWDEYKIYHKGTNDAIAQMVREHFQAADKYSKLGLNSKTQGRGAVIFKDSGKALFDWIVDNGYFNKIKLCVGVHDEWNIEFPQELKDTYPQLVAQTMKESAAKYCHSLPIPATPEIEKYWKH